jgi:hypothetical protein
MIAICFNPACNRELLYLRNGRVVRVIRGEGDDVSVEHYWLCGPCYVSLDFVFPADGSVILGAKSNGMHIDEPQFSDVLLPERRSVKRAPGSDREPYQRASSLSR